MTELHISLSIQAAVVAASAIRAVHSMTPLLGPPNGEITGFQHALDSLLLLYRPPLPKPCRPPRPRKPPKPRVVRRRVEPEPEPILEVDEAESPWDPEPLYEASRCQALLMAVIQRAASDYVLYRQHHKLELKALAEQAYIWLFEEEPGHPAWRAREKAIFKVEDEGQVMVEVGSRRLTSFVSICEACNLDPDAVRQRAREMTVESVMRTGRHTERRSSRSSSESMSYDTHSLVDISIELLDVDHSSSSQDYESSDAYGIDALW